VTCAGALKLVCCCVFGVFEAFHSLHLVAKMTDKANEQGWGSTVKGVSEQIQATTDSVAEKIRGTVGDTVADGLKTTGEYTKAGIQNTGEYVGLKGSKVGQRPFRQRQSCELDFDCSVDTADVFLQPTSDKAHDDLSNLADDVKGKFRG